jgi:Tfp pilus assembly PilM family ATPase
MALDEMIEQLSFGRTLPRLDTCLGLYVSPDSMFLSEVKLEGNRPQTLHLVPLPVPGGEAASVSKTRTVGTLNTEFLGEQEKLLAIMKKALGGTHWGSKHIMVTLSHHFGLLRYFAMPAIDRRFWKTAVPAEAKKYVPIPFGSLSHDYQVRQIGPGPDKKPRMGALFGVTHVQNVANLKTLVEKLGLTLIGTELADRKSVV